MVENISTNMNFGGEGVGVLAVTEKKSRYNM